MWISGYPFCVVWYMKTKIFGLCFWVMFMSNIFLGDLKFLMAPGVLISEKLISIVGFLFYSNCKIITFLIPSSLVVVLFFSWCTQHKPNEGGFFSVLFLFKFSSLPLHIPSVIINPLQQLSWCVMLQQRCMNIFWVINGCWNAIRSEHCCYA